MVIIEIPYLIHLSKIETAIVTFFFHCFQSSLGFSVKMAKQEILLSTPNNFLFFDFL